jgi:hypothetical protein
VSYREYRGELAIKILAGFAANPAIFAGNDRCGWALVNCTDADIAGYAVRLADQLMHANEYMAQGSFPAQNASKDDRG